MARQLSLFVFMLLGLGLGAQAPAAFSYQGAARGANGLPLSEQAISIRASILESVNGPVLYSEVHQVTTNPFGLFTLQVGRGIVQAGDFSQIGWAESPHFLRIEMDADGGVDFEPIGTAQLLSVPYALYAATAGEGSGGLSPWQETATSVLYSAGNKPIGIRSAQPVFGLQMADNGIPGLATIRLTSTNGDSNIGMDFGVGGARRWVISVRGRDYPDQPGAFIINYHDDNAFLPETAFMIGPTGLVGIRTLDPKARLHVAEGDVYIDNPFHGVIMRSPNGQCWRMTVSDTGQPVMTAIACPN